MRLSVSTLACPNWSFPQVVGAAAAHGFAGIDPRGVGPEIDITRLALFGDEIESTLELLRGHGLSLPCLNTSVVLVSTEPDSWDDMLDECRRYAALAERVGAGFLRVFGGAVPRGLNRDEAATVARRHLAQLHKLCAARSCQVLLETHDDWATGDRAMELLARFTPEEVGALWDVDHSCRAGESPRATAATLGPYLRHVHFKDSVRENGKSVPRLIGHGDLPVEQAVSALRSIGYDAWICLETEKRWHPERAPEPEESLPQFVGWMRRHWH
jgi:sugar phosphate isomerase/epimerase